MTVSLTACGSKEKPAEPEEPVVTDEETEAAEEAESEFPKTMYVTAEEGLLLRKGPGKKNDVVSALSYGQEIQVEKTEDGWAYTTADGNKGWCSMEYLTENKGDIKDADKIASANADPNKLVEPTNTSVEGYHGYVDSPEGLNMRFGPGEKYNIIGWINAHYFTLEGGKEKPVIYLYPEETADVTVRISLTDGSFTKCIPEGDGEWNVTASPDGTLTDKATGKTYDYIFWESTDNTEYDWSEGYVVKGSEAEVFLRGILRKMGLNEKEYTEFIDYWQPRLEKNEYNLISFQTDRYTESARLDVSPQPDSVLRVFMAFKSIDGPVFVARPDIEPFEREGFTVVEWGGAEVR